MPNPLDPRRNAYRADLAAEHLRGQVSAPRFVEGELKAVVAGAAPVRSRPDSSKGWTSQALYGETVKVYEEKDGWAWVQAMRDDYVGYMPADALTSTIEVPTHRVAVPGTYRYAAPDAKALTVQHLPMTALVRVTTRRSNFAQLPDGSFVPFQHLIPCDTFAPDFVAVAEQLLGTPYVWGGRTRLGLDCSGLVQVALNAAGYQCPRDSDMQMAELGAPVEARPNLSGLERGDLVFWKGHVGIMVDPSRLLHANAHHMAVALEPLKSAVDRISATGSSIAAVRRIRPRGS